VTPIISAPAADIPNAASQAAFAPAAASISADEPSSEVAASVAAAAGAGSASGSAPVALTFPTRPDGKPTVLYSLKELEILLGDGAKLNGSRVFDGTQSRGVLVDPTGASPSIPEGVTSVETHPLSDASDVDLIPRQGNSESIHDELRANLSKLVPLDIFVYHDALGGRFLGLDLSRNPDNVERLREFQPHEIVTIRRIQSVTRDLQVLVREEGATPDLIVRGIPTEIKSVHHGDVGVQAARANAQLVALSRRHGLGLGAIALEIVGRALPVEHVEKDLAKVVRSVPALGFDRVYAFNAGEWQTYARGVDGEFRLSPSAPPFSAPRASAAHVSVTVASRP
jgi:hypothetical protein